MSKDNYNKNIEKEALLLHEGGKIATQMPKPIKNQVDLSLAYSPGVGYPTLKIHENPELSFKYTARGNFVAVVSNGTAVLGFGDLGAHAAKPVMEGKVVLLKSFADVDGIDICIDSKNSEEIINIVEKIALNYGGINLEDIKAPECFIIERELQKRLNIPVFHDDQHGTAVVLAAGMINALKLTNRQFPTSKFVINGAGAAAIACAKLLLKLGVKRENMIMCDTRGVIYSGRSDGMNEWKAEFAVETNARSLQDALVGADVFVGLSVKGAVTPDMVKSMAESPIIFAMANPNPEITPEEVEAIRNDCIIATGRSDYPNQINNVICFPYIFRGALDVRARCINDEMKLAAAYAIANLVHKKVGDAAAEKAYAGRLHKFGKDYIIPVPFDSRLLQEVSVAVAQAAMQSGVAQQAITDINAYKRELAKRKYPAAYMLQNFVEIASNSPKTLIFTEGEEEYMVKAALRWSGNNCGKAILIGYEDKVLATLNKLGVYELDETITIVNAAILREKTEQFIELYYQRMQRSGESYREAARTIKHNRNVFGAYMLEHGLADGMVAGGTSNFTTVLKDISHSLPLTPGQTLFSLSVLSKGDRSIFIADTAIHENPSAEQLATIAIQAANEIRGMGHVPRVALLSHSNFGTHNSASSLKMRTVCNMLAEKNVDFEYEGEITADVALDCDLKNRLYPFSRLSAPANLFIMPNLDSAVTTERMLVEFGNCYLVGSILCGLSHSVQILQNDADASHTFNLAAIAAFRSMILDNGNKQK